jgi:hypothetical protein
VFGKDWDDRLDECYATLGTVLRDPVRVGEIATRSAAACSTPSAT